MSITQPTATLITIGNEILIGRTRDTNVHYIAKQLNAAGIKVLNFITIPDEESHILRAFATSQADILISTGGLGATLDDITRKTLCQFMECELITHQPTLENLTHYYHKRNIEINPLTATMANVPSKATIFVNQVGAAPGLFFDTGTIPDNPNQILMCFPGVPYEMEYLFAQHALPILQQRYTQGFILSRTLRLTGIPESKTALALADIEKAFPPYLSLAYNPSLNLLDLRLTLQCSQSEIKEYKIIYDHNLDAITERLKDYIFGFDTDTLEGVLGQKLIQNKKTIATAESCTGGALCGRLVSQAGASAYVYGGIVAYSNQIKINQLGVSAQTLENHGAVSELCAMEMAKGVKNQLGADIGVSTTGIAGPEGATATKPVGTVWIGYADAEKNFARCFTFEQDRKRNIERTIIAALNMVRLAF